jgi:hypothetical protein
MRKRVFRRGAGKPIVLVGAAAAWVGAAAVFIVLSVPWLLPRSVADLFWGPAGPSATPAIRVLGFFFALALAGAGLFLRAVAPFLGGMSVTVSEEGIECVDGEVWVRAPWSHVKAIRKADDDVYTVMTEDGAFTFSPLTVDGATELAALIQAESSHGR